MNRRDIVIGLVVLAVVVGAVYWTRSRQQASVVTSPSPAPSIEESLESRFNLQIPEDVEKADLTDVSGGDGSGIATRKLEAGLFSHTVLADLPDPTPGTFYEGWLVRGREGEANFAFISTGKLGIAKGGYLLEFSSRTDYSDYTGVVVTSEKVDDKKPETHILEGSF